MASSEQLQQMSVYAHLTPTTHPDQICETVKLTLNASSEEESKVRADTVQDLVA